MKGRRARAGAARGQGRRGLRGWLGLAALVATALVVTVVVVRTAAPSVPADTQKPVFGSPGLQIPVGQQKAEEGCRLLLQALDGVVRNGDAATIERELTDGRNRATEAAYADPLWLRLASASQMLHDGVVANDAARAAQGAAAVRDQCSVFQGLPAAT